MVQIVVLITGLLLIVESQASDVAEHSPHQGFLPKYVPSVSDASQSPMSDYDSFITPNFKHVKHENGPDAVWYHNNPAEHGPFTTVDDKPVLHPTTKVQDSMAFMPARGESSINNKDFDPPRTTNKEEKQAAQKLLANNSHNPTSLSAIGFGLLSLVTMLVVRLRRGLQPATILASSGGLGPDMPMNAKSALGDNVMEMKSQDFVCGPRGVAGAGSSALSLAASAPTTQGYATRLHATVSSKVEEEVDLCEVLNATEKEFQRLGCTGPRIRLIAEARDGKQGRDASRHSTILSHIEALENENPTPKPLESPLLSGRWRLVFTTSEAILGTKRLRPFRPRRRILQHINAKKLKAKNVEWVLGGLLRNSVRAKLVPRDDGATVDVIFKRFGIGWLKLPAPKSARGFLTTTYLDDEMRISRGDKGNVFVLVKEGKTRI
jgi:hypothetical protein